MPASRASATTRVPAAFADATPASVSSKTSVSSGATPRALEREQVALRIGLAARHVVVGDDGREQVPEPGRGDDRHDLLARGAGDDRKPRALGCEAHRGARRLGHRRPVRDRRSVAVDPLPDEAGNARVAGAEADLGDRVLGEPGEPLVVVAVGDRHAVLGEELAVDPAEDGLVVGERAVEVEDDRADRHVTREITLLRDAALRPPARARGGIRARALEPLARASARSRGGDGGGPRRRGDRLRAGVAVRLGARAGGLALPRGHELPAAPLLRAADHRIPEGRGVGRLPGRPWSRARDRPARRHRRARIRHLVGRRRRASSSSGSACSRSEGSSVAPTRRAWSSGSRSRP